MLTKPLAITLVLSNSTSILNASSFPRFVLQRRGRLGVHTQLVKPLTMKLGGQIEEELGDRCDQKLEAWTFHLCFKEVGQRKLLFIKLVMWL